MFGTVERTLLLPSKKCQLLWHATFFWLGSTILIELIVRKKRPHTIGLFIYFSVLTEIFCLDRNFLFQTEIFCFDRIFLFQTEFFCFKQNISVSNRKFQTEIFCFKQKNSVKTENSCQNRNFLFQTEKFCQNRKFLSKQKISV